MAEMNKLSVIITTYNRKERLLNQLRSLFIQDKYIYLHILILDNNSNYDLNKVLERNFSKEELSIIDVIQRPFNIGMVGNLSTSFLYCNTKWMWLLSDDDETMPNSIETILHDIEQNEETAVLKYSIKGFVPEEDKEIATIDQFIEYYKSGIHSSGNLIFMSNNIFNLELLNPYLGFASIYSYTYIPHVIPMIAGLSEQKITVKFCPTPVVSFIPAEPGKSWNFVSVIVGLSSFADINFGLNSNQRNQLCSIVVRNFSHIHFIESLLLMKDRKQQKYYYQKVFISLYIHDNLHHWMYFIIYHLSYLLRIDFLKSIRHIYKYIKSLRRI